MPAVKVDDELTVPANASRSLPFYASGNLPASLQNLVGWTTTSSQLYANVTITDTSGIAPQAYAMVVYNNPGLGGSFNMTTACAINPPVSAAVSSTTSTTFDGVVTLASGTNGTFSLTIPAVASSSSAVETTAAVEKAAAVERALATVTVSGSYTPPTGAAVTLTGTYNTVTRAINLSGGGYTFTGSVSGTGAVSGSFTGPSVTGSFGGGKKAAGTTSKGYCGTYSGHDEDGPTSGTLSFVVSGTTLTGSHRSGGDGGPISGTVSGTSFTAYAPSDGGIVTVTGTLGTTSFSGSYSGGPVGGTFSGSSCGNF